MPGMHEVQYLISNTKNWGEGEKEGREGGKRRVVERKKGGKRRGKRTKAVKVNVEIK